MKLPAHELIAQLTAKTSEATETVRGWHECDTRKLNFKSSPESWSILECLEHLNLYGDFYLVEMERRILAAGRTSSGIFKSGVIGNYFANLMVAKEGMKKMKSPKDKNPTNSDLSVATVDRFLKQQEQLLRLLELAKSVDLTTTKTAISLSPLIRLRLGDTFRFYVYHIERHVLQAQRLL